SSGGDGKAVRERVAWSFDITSDQYVRGLRERELLRRATAEMFRGADALLLPSMPCTAPPIATLKARVNGKEYDGAWIHRPFLSSHNLTGYPALSVPMGFRSRFRSWARSGARGVCSLLLTRTKRQRRKFVSGARSYNPAGFSKEATMRRWLVACLSFVVTAVLVAGSASAQTITWWEHSNPPHNNYSKELVADWNKTHPTMQVEYEFFAMTPYFKKLSAALSTRSAADMFTVIDTLLPSFTTKEVLAPIRPEWLGYKNLDDMKKAYLPGALDGYIHDGKLYAVPMIASVFSLYLNRQHFREAGLDPDKDYPRTWE